MNTIFFFLIYMYNFFFFVLVALGWGVALAHGLAGLTPGPALVSSYYERYPCFMVFSTYESESSFHAEYVSPNIC
jgi:hypothetical protein